MSDALNIQWFPGHMAKARRAMEEDLKLVDAVCEVIDARIPVSSRNPDIARMAAGKPKLVILNRADQADPAATDRWAAYFAACGVPVLRTDAKTGRGVGGFTGAVRALMKDKIAANAAKGQAGRPIRIMVVGIPNVGKSSLINRVAGRRAAETSDRPGVTRGRQWVRIGDGIEMLDTPGVLWPKFDDKRVGEHLSFTGAVKDVILDGEALACRLLETLRDAAPDSLRERYGFEPEPALTGYDMLALAAKRRGFLLRGGAYDTERMAAILLDEFRGGKLGRITLEAPPEVPDGT